MHMQVVHNAYTPKETTELCSRSGMMKANMRADKVFMSSFKAGCLLAFACACTLSVSVSPWYQENAPGVISLLGAVVFPWGLVAILSTGTDLCTGSFMLTTIAVLHRRLSPWKMLLHWFITFWGNLAGSLFVMAVIIGYGGTFSQPTYHARVVAFGTAKAITPASHQVFLGGIGANWLVCLAAYLSFMGREYFSKVVGIWWPTFAFVLIGLDHVVADMAYISLAIFNIVGVGLFVGVMYWYLYLAGEDEPTSIDDKLFAADKRPLIGRRSDGEAFDEGSGARTPRSPHGKESKDPENMV